MEKNQWIEMFVLNAMSNYAALNYDHNCFVGWGSKEKKMTYCDAVTLAEQAWIRKENNEGF